MARRVPDDLDQLSAAGFRPVVQRLDVLIALLARVQPKSERVSLSDRIRLLGELGLDNATIGQIVGRGADFVGVVRRRGSGKKTALRREGTKRARKAIGRGRTRSR